jgi:hypothetical protein
LPIGLSTFDLRWESWEGIGHTNVIEWKMQMNKLGHLKWIGYVALLGFGSVFIFEDLLMLPVDLYFLIYFGIIITFFYLYIKKTQLNLREWFFRKLVCGVLLGLIFGALLVQNVLSRPETERFTGAYLVWLIFWRGLVYGVIDGLLLSSFPWMVTRRAFHVSNKPSYSLVS